MPKLVRSANELRAMILAEAVRQPACRNIDILVRPDPVYGWKADIVSPNQTGYADCSYWIGSIERRLRGTYELDRREAARHEAAFDWYLKRPPR